MQQCSMLPVCLFIGRVEEKGRFIIIATGQQLWWL
jgi:hypothetical protein